MVIAVTFFSVSIPASFAKKVSATRRLFTSRKRKRLQELCNKTFPVGFQAKVPGMSGVLSALRSHITNVSTRKEINRINKRGNGITLGMLQRLHNHAKTMYQKNILDEIDQAIQADVWWDPIVRIEAYETTEMVYDFTVNQNLQSFMLGNGVFVHNTLNTFHSAGTGNRTVMSGVPRFKEMIDCTKNPKAPSMTIFLNDDLATSKDAVQEIAHGMRKVLLAECVLGTPTVHHKTDAVPEDEGMVERYRIVRGWDPAKLFDFYARVRLDKPRLAVLNLGLRDVVRALRASLDEKAIVLASEPREEEYAVQVHVFKTTCASKRLRPRPDRGGVHEAATRLRPQHGRHSRRDHAGLRA